MEITNDPRFFQEESRVQQIRQCAWPLCAGAALFLHDNSGMEDNVINYRLAAFAGLGVVAGLMVQNSMDALWKC